MFYMLLLLPSLVPMSTPNITTLCDQLSVPGQMNPHHLNHLQQIQTTNILSQGLATVYTCIDHSLTYHTSVKLYDNEIFQ